MSDVSSTAARLHQALGFGACGPRPRGRFQGPAGCIRSLVELLPNCPDERTIGPKDSTASVAMGDDFTPGQRWSEVLPYESLPASLIGVVQVFVRLRTVDAVLVKSPIGPGPKVMPRLSVLKQWVSSQVCISNSFPTDAAKKAKLDSTRLGIQKPKSRNKVQQHNHF